MWAGVKVCPNKFASEKLISTCRIDDLINFFRWKDAPLDTTNHLRCNGYKTPMLKPQMCLGGAFVKMHSSCFVVLSSIFLQVFLKTNFEKWLNFINYYNDRFFEFFSHLDFPSKPKYLVLLAFLRFCHKHSVFVMLHFDFYGCSTWFWGLKSGNKKVLYRQNLRCFVIARN